MWLNELLNKEYYYLLTNKYNEVYLNNIDKELFITNYKLLKSYNVPCIEDIIVKYLELFTINTNILEEKLLLFKIKYNTFDVIKYDMNLLDTFIEL